MVFTIKQEKNGFFSTDACSIKPATQLIFASVQSEFYLMNDSEIEKRVLWKLAVLNKRGRGKGERSARVKVNRNNKRRVKKSRNMKKERGGKEKQY